MPDPTVSLSETSDQPTETRARRKIREAVEALGLRVEDMYWEPITPGSEMSGAAGGWEVWIVDKHGEGVDTVLGYSWQEVVENVERHADEWLRDEPDYDGGMDGPDGY